MSMDQFLETLSIETLKELKKSAVIFAESNEGHVDGEAEIDKLLMMHMSKHHHEDELPEFGNVDESNCINQTL
jgi:S-adenosylhomocysteine hydrolase